GVCFLARVFVSMRRMFGSESGLDRLRMSVCLTTTLNNARINESRCFYYCNAVFSSGGKSHRRHLFSYSSAGRKSKQGSRDARIHAINFTRSASAMIVQPVVARLPQQRMWKQIALLDPGSA